MDDDYNAETSDLKRYTINMKKTQEEKDNEMKEFLEVNDKEQKERLRESGYDENSESVMWR